jgi:hypothetical protein
LRQGLYLIILILLRNKAGLPLVPLYGERGLRMMRRILVLLTVVAMMVVMLAMAASSAMAKNTKVGQGEPLFSGNETLVTHCGPFIEQGTVLEGFHGVEVVNKSRVEGLCIHPPPPR